MYADLSSPIVPLSIQLRFFFITRVTKLILLGFNSCKLMIYKCINRIVYLVGIIKCAAFSTL